MEEALRLDRPPDEEDGNEREGGGDEGREGECRGHREGERGHDSDRELHREEGPRAVNQPVQSTAAGVSDFVLGGLECVLLVHTPKVEGAAAAVEGPSRSLRGA